MFNTVRALALGRRPSKLDEFGLPAALERRDFTRRYAMNVDLKMEGDFDAWTGVPAMQQGSRAGSRITPRVVGPLRA